MRRRGALGTAELRLQRWRTGVAIAAGLVTFASLAVAALNFRHDLAVWWVVATLTASTSLMLVLGLVAVTIVRSARPRARGAGPADDVFDDLAPVLGLPALRRLELPGHPWRLALLVAAAASAPVALGGFVDGDPFDGLIRASTEIAAVLGCFSLFGRSLGLRRF